MYTPVSKYDKLENELKLKQLQIKSLLSITQAINENIPADGLYSMYKTFLNWDMGVGKMALFTESTEGWESVAQIGINYNVDTDEIKDRLFKYERTSPVKEEDRDFLPEFDVVIPVYHKKHPIAFSLIGEIRDDNGDVYDHIQFINTITNIVAVAIENKRLFKKQIEQERFKRSLELAAEMQRMLIPDTLPSSKEIEFDFYYKPHFNVGGDYLDIFEFGKDKFIFCIADVSGKGVAAALLMANFQALLRSMVDKFQHLETLVQSLNEGVFRITKGEKFISFFIGCLDLKRNLFEYVNAGHNAPLFLSASGPVWLESGCPILGVVNKFEKIERGMELLDKDSLIFCYTDGISEYKEPNGNFLGMEFIQKFAAENRHLKAKKFNERFLSTLKKLGGEKSFVDDIALITCVYKKPK